MLLALPPGFPRPLRRFINDCTNFIFLLLRGLVNIDWTEGCRCRVLTRWLLLIRPSPIEANAIQAFYTFRRELGLFKRLPLSVNLWRRGNVIRTSMIGSSGQKSVELSKTTPLTQYPRGDFLLFTLQSPCFALYRLSSPKRAFHSSIWSALGGHTRCGFQQKPMLFRRSLRSDVSLDCRNIFRCDDTCDGDRMY